MALTKGVYSNNEEQIYQILKANGSNLAQICGILANIEYESTFNPAKYNSSEGAYGLCQWREGRRTNLISKFGNSPSISNQINFIFLEFDSSEKVTRDKFKTIANTRDGAYNAGYYFADLYERCADEYNIPRAERAQDYWDHYSGTPTILEPSGDLTFRVLTFNGGSESEDEGSPSTYGDVTTRTGYIANNLSRVTADGFSYGVLIDLSYGGEFKFYIPEFQESAGAQWDDVSIPGRSVGIKSYQSTSSRVVSISLDLYAGVGFYVADTLEESVTKMHKDANFVKSLEYPDYNAQITRPPAQVHLILGSAFDMEGVVSGVTVEHMKPLDPQNRAMYMKLSFTVTQNVLNPPSWNDIREGITAITTSANLPDPPSNKKRRGRSERGSNVE